MKTQEPRASEIDAQTYEPEVRCGSYCQGGVVVMRDTEYPEHTDASDVWVRGSEYLAIAARMNELQRERDEAHDKLAEKEAMLEQIREAVDPLIRYLLKFPIRESGVGGMTCEATAARSFYAAKVPLLAVERVRAALVGRLADMENDDG